VEARKQTKSRWYPLPAFVRRIAAEHKNSVLLETARQEGESDKSFLFLDPVRVLTAHDATELRQLFDELDSLIEQGHFVAGYFVYECGEYLVGLNPLSIDREHCAGPLAWLGVYARRVVFDHASGLFDGALPVSRSESEGGVPQGLLRIDGLAISAEEYARGFATIQGHLSAGDTYQVNFTTTVEGSVLGSPLAVYDQMLRRQPVSFAAYVNLPEETVLSFSPELFYRVADGQITVRPMKGTWPRGVDAAGDHEAAKALRHDEKNRAEHVMIVDLLRNDVGQIAEPGSVDVKSLMDVEQYATLLQMTSTISATVRDGVSAATVFQSMFPSGSITGAPKRRTMEIIRDMERGPRGIYTGAIGYFGPGNEACFNVAIRTMRVKDGLFSMGVGGGVTADSTAKDEYKECELKAAFLTREAMEFSLIETMRCESGIALLAGHLERLAASADYFGVEYDAAGLRLEMDAAVREAGDEVSRVRLELHRDGTWEMQRSSLDVPRWQGRVLLARETTVSTDVFLHHKTTRRAFYDQGLLRAKQQGFDEVLFRNEKARLTEAAISNVFLRVDGMWVTPSLRCGVLPGVMRAVLIERWNAVERDDVDLPLLQRAEAVVLCNALRGVRDVTCVLDDAGSVVWQEKI